MSFETVKNPMKGADILVSCLERAGIKNVFAYPGGMSIELHQSLSKSKIRVILPRHEQGGGFMAEGVARATGNTGVCMVTSGPGATNLVTAIADAYADSIPVVFITGQVPTSLIGKNAFQETDVIGMTRPFVKHSFLVLSADEIPQIMAKAFFLANSGRPGPIVVDIPKDVQLQKCVPEFTEDVTIRAYRHRHCFDLSHIEPIVNMIKESERPCLYIGGGIVSANASHALIKFAESYNIPVTTTLMGSGAFPEDHPLSLKWLGMHGTYYANYAVNEADLVLAFGVRFDDRVTGNVAQFAAKAKIVHVDIDFSEINKNKQVTLGIVADILDVLTGLNQNPLWKPYKAWHEKIQKWKTDYPLTYKKKEDVVQPQYVIETLCQLTNGEAIIVPGVGQHQMWSAQYYTYKHPRQLITSAGLGTMGFGLPTAIGIKIVCPDKMVINIDGDGSFQMNIQELATLKTEDVPVKMIILNNQHLGMVAQWEDCFYGGNRANTVLADEDSNRPYPDFVTIAKGYGIAGREVYTKEEVKEALQEMIDCDGPFLLDVHTAYEEHVLPMIPAGKSYKEIIVSE